MTLLSEMKPAGIAAPALHQLTAAQLVAWQEDGFLLVPKLFSTEEIDICHRFISTESEFRDGRFGVINAAGKPAELFGWDGHSEDLLGTMTRIRRVAEMTSDLLGGEDIYHWHSKISFKEPRSEGAWDWHQDYGSWYREGCLRPEMLTCMIAIDATDRANGCVNLVRGSHIMGRVDHVAIGKSVGTDPEFVEKALAEMELVECDLAPGDAVFFHSNTLHASGANSSDRSRTVLHLSYNTVRNAPFRGFRGHQYVPLQMKDDDAILSGAYRLGVDPANLSGKPSKEWEKFRTDRNDYGYSVEKPRKAG